jgi:hypothetical protein
MTSQSKILAALTRAARLQTDPVKREKILAKIKVIKQRESHFKFLAQ